MDETVSGSAQLRRLAFAMEAAGVGSWEWDVPTGDIWWSDNLAAIHGIGPDAFDGTFAGFLSVVDPDDVTRLNDAIGQTFATGGEFDVEFRVPGSDGRLRWIQGKGRLFATTTATPSA